MTGPAVPGDDELREALAARIPFTTDMLFHGPSEWPNRDERLRIADLLLPVVRRWAEQRAAEELRAIVLDAVIVGEVMHTQGPIRVPVAYLDERADALDPLTAP